MTRNFLPLFILTTILCVTVGVASAQQTPDGTPYRISLQWENDSSFISPLNPNDRYYTNGIRVDFAFKPEGLTPLLAALPFSPADDDEDLETAMGIAGGQNIYTPDDLRRHDLIKNDRPYAGWLYGGLYVQRANDHVFDHLELDVGTTGQASLADETQKFIHDNFHAIHPEGWRHQIGDELGFNVIYTRKWKLSLLGEPGHDGAVELIPQAGMTLGTINRQFDAGVTLRAGWNLPYDFGPARIVDPASATHIHRKPRSPGVYAFVRFGGSVVEHDTFIQGNNFRDSHGVDANPLVGTFEGGFVGQISLFGPDTLELGWSHTVVTEQFDGQAGEAHIGSWKLSWTCFF
ncbi:MAG: DUF2219 family protein [Phycisphaera sp.]|nr:DUF2219 family protein [Phycisphaera sp.]